MSLRQEVQRFKASLGYIVKSRLKKKIFKRLLGGVLVSFVSLTHIRITREERPYHEELHSSDWSVGNFVGALSC